MSLENIFSNIKRGVKSIVFPILFGAFLSCSPVDIPEPTARPTPFPSSIPTSAPEVPKNVKPISHYIGEKIISFNENQINFSESIDEVNSLSYGDIIVFNKGSLIPKGLLAKVTGISSNGKTIYTTSAAFDEVIKNYSFSLDNYKLKPSQIVSSTLEKGITRIDSGDFTYNFKDVVLFDFDGNTLTTYDQIIANGKISFDTNFSLDFEMGDSLEKLSFEGEFIDNIDITASSSDSFSNIDEYKQIAYHEFPDIWLTIPVTPPIPIIITPAIEFGVGIEGHLPKLSTHLSQNATLTIGASYNGRWYPIHDFQNNFNFNPPHFSGDSEVFAYASGKFLVYLYHSIGGYAEAKAGPEFKSWIEGVNNYWELSGRLQGDLGIDIGIFGRSLADFNANLIDYSRLLGSGSEQLPLETLVIQPGPEGKDAYVKLIRWNDGSESYSGEGDSDYLEIFYEDYGRTIYESLIQFPLSSIPSTAEVVSAKLALYGQGAFVQETSNIYVNKITSSWDESSVKWNTKPSYGDIISSSTMTDETKWHEWNITSVVQDWINGSFNYGLALKTYDSRPVLSDHSFKSSDYSDSTKRPKLIIQYID